MQRRLLPRFDTVIHSLMPKGVEHVAYDRLTLSELRVIHSLMPKGVEHTNEQIAILADIESDSFVDAERR